MVDVTDEDPLPASSTFSPRRRITPRKFQTDSPERHYFVINGILKISDHSIGVGGAAALLRAARESPQLKELDLSGCSISKGDELGEIIRNAPNLRRLVLEWNSLGLARTGIAALFSAIASSKTLKEVDLRSNRIGPTTAAALAHALRNNCSLTSLDLRWNEIGPTGATALIGLLERNRTLTELHLSGNSIPPNLQSQIDRLLENNQIGTPHEDYMSIFSPRQHVEFRRQGDDTNHEERRANLQSELLKLRENLESLKDDCQSLQMQKEATNIQLQTVKNELKEESLLRKYIEKEGQEFKEQALKAKEDIFALEERLHIDNSTQNAILMEAQEMHAAAISECQALQDQILRLREEHSSELRDLAERARKEADYNLTLINRMDATLREHDQLYMEEINNLRLRLSTESQAREEALREIEKHRTMALTAEHNWLQEKDAHQQALNNLTTVNTQFNSLQGEAGKLMKQISKTKKSHAAEMEELEQTIAYQKQFVNRAELAKSEFTAERTQLLENIRLLEDKGKVLEKKLELERLQHAETLQNELIRQKDERKNWEKEMRSERKAAELAQQRLEEILEEQERKKYDNDRKLHEAEAIITDAVRQQFGELRAASSTRPVKFS